MATQNAFTQLLRAYGRGDQEAAQKLFSLVYDELLAIARLQLRNRPSETINTTALVHETYLKMVERTAGSWHDKAHFFSVATLAMRQILVDHARKYRAEKRGGKAQRTLIDVSVLGGESPVIDVLDLDHGLTRLASLNTRLSQVVEFRFFGGLSVQETAQVLGISTRTVNRDWYKAKALLYLILYDREAA